MVFFSSSSFVRKERFYCFWKCFTVSNLSHLDYWYYFILILLIVLWFWLMKCSDFEFLSSPRQFFFFFFFQVCPSKICYKILSYPLLLLKNYYFVLYLFVSFPESCMGVYDPWTYIKVVKYFFTEPLLTLDSSYNKSLNLFLIKFL